MSIYSEEMEKLPSGEKERSKQQFRKLAKSYPPYNFVTTYARIMIDLGKNSPEGIFARQFGAVLGMEANKDINDQLKLVEIEKDIIKLVEQTDNKIFYRPLFFPSIFINNDFIFENLIIKGIYITDCFSEPGSNKYALHHPDHNDYAVFIVSADIEQGCEFYTNFALINRCIGENFTDTKEEHLKMKRSAEYIRLLICNIIDMVEGNDEDLEIVTIKSTREQNLKRIKRGQIPTPDKVFIRSKGKFKKYISEFNKEINKPSHSFAVRGHWRHYNDPRYVNLVGTKQWIKPFIKGKGIFMKKDYKITD